jgi:hypothetical protein
MTILQNPSASDRAYLWTRDRILDGTFATGGMITEGEISGSVGVSRTPVREAFLVWLPRASSSSSPSAARLSFPSLPLRCATLSKPGS